MADYYSDNPGRGAAEEPAGGGAPPPEEEAQTGDDEQPTGLLPKSILAGKDFKPGEEIVLKIVRIMDDQVEVAYAPEKPKEGGEEAGEGMHDEGAERGGEQMPLGDAQMRSYME